MRKKEKVIKQLELLFMSEKVLTLATIINKTRISRRSSQRYLDELNSLTSYTHKGMYVTLPTVPKFDKNGLWFYSEIGFSKYGSSLNSILELIERSQNGITKEEIEDILQIKIFKQIQMLLDKEKLHRVKLGNKYLYMPDNIINNNEMKNKILASRQTEAYTNKNLRLMDIVSILRIVLIEAKIEVNELPKIIKKYNLAIPLSKLQKIINHYDLTKKKSP